jgi:hypothetical protein
MEDKFLRAGADFFLQKPFPCKPDDLRKELARIVHSKRPLQVEEALERFTLHSISSTCCDMDDSDTTAIGSA